MLKSIVSEDGKDAVIVRPDYDSDANYVDMSAQLEGEKIPLTLEVEPVKLPADKAYELFEKAKATIAEKIPANVTEGKLELINELDGMEIFWISSDERIISNEGVVNPYELSFGESKDIQLTAVMNLAEYRYECEFEIKVNCNFPESPEQKRLWLNSRINKYMTDNEEAAEIKLPESIDGIDVEYMHSNDMPVEILAIILLAVIGVFAAQKLDNKQQQNNKKRQMEMDYCEIVSKLVMLMGAGLTIRNAWHKTASDYENKKLETGVRYAYEEMVITVNELSAGVPERIVYENYGKRCKLPRYVKLGSLLQQNFLKGSKQLLTLLEAESDAAFEDRKLLAKKQGEEAGTKLLIPMVLELVAVMAIVMVPALMNF